MTKCMAPVFVGAEKPLELREFDIPQVGAGEGLVRMVYAGICGSDAREWHNPETETPMIFGHENVGVLEKLGEGKKYDAVGQEISEGDYVAFCSVAPCMNCYTCVVLKEFSQCERGIKYGLSRCDSRPYLRGGYGEYVHLMPGVGIVKIQGKEHIQQALLAAIGNKTLVHAIQRANGISAGDTVVVQGTGPIGLSAIVQAKLCGGRVIAIGAPSHRLDLARSLGAIKTLNIEELKTPKERVRAISDLTDGKGADVVIEASGASTACDEALQMVRIGGKFILVGMDMTKRRTMDPFQVTRKGIHVTGTYAASPTDLYKAMLDLRDVEIPFDRIFTHKFPMVEATEGLLSVDRLEPVIGLIDHSR